MGKSNGEGNEGGESSIIVKPADFNKRKVVGISYLLDKLGYCYSTERPFSRSFIDEHGLVQGLYNVYINRADPEKFRCEVRSCTEILKEIHFRIVAAMDADDAQWYTIANLAKDPAVFDALINTNRKLVMCLTHRAPALMITGEQVLTRRASITSIAEGEKIRAEKKRRKKRDPLRLT